MLESYPEWVKSAPAQTIEFVKSVYKLCTDNYDAGGDTIVECFSPQEIVNQFKSLEEVKEFCGIKIEQELNARWGEDTDAAVGRAKNFENWKS